ncbi:MAG: FAD-dependent monooxygenase [Ardenticatenales bacterium]|nr:FAD-dependent monooxygenase [Ardenticatenales bacterium]
MHATADPAGLNPLAASRPLTALVIGGGVGGIAAGIALSRAGASVTVLERAEALRSGGAGLWLWPNALHALDALGVGDSARAAGVRQTSNRVRDTRGRTLVRIRVPDANGQPYVSLSIRRAALLTALAEGLPPGALRCGAHVVGVTQGDTPGDARGDTPGDAVERATVQLADGTVLTADFVIAADGVGSSVRRSLFGTGGQRDAGFTAFRAIVSLDRASELEGGVIWGRGARFGALAVAPDTAYWFAGFDAPLELLPIDRLAHVAARLAGWPAPVGTLLAATQPDDVRVDRVVYCTPPPAWSVGRIALLGDAAHAMTPSLGQGACQALEDAVALGEVIAAGGHDVVAALAAYGRRRRRRAAVVAARSIRMDRLVQIENPVLCRLRDAAVAAAPELLRRRFQRSMWGLPFPSDPSRR